MYSFKQTARYPIPGDTTTTPKTQIINGTIFGNTIIVAVHERNQGSTISAVTLNGTAMTLLLLVGSTSGALNMNQGFWGLAVPAGGGSLTISVSASGSFPWEFGVAEYGGIFNNPVTSLAGTGTFQNNSATVNLNLSLTASAAIITSWENVSGGAIISALSGTDRTGLNNVTNELNDQVGIPGNNSITMTAAGSAAGVITTALQLTGGGLMMSGKGGA